MNSEDTFRERCYSLLRQVPKGMVTTYADLAHALGGRAYRAVGSAMNKNPYAPEVPCHRVVKSTGEVGGFAKGTDKKIRMLRKEGIKIRDGQIANLGQYRFRNFHSCFATAGGSKEK